MSARKPAEAVPAAAVGDFHERPVVPALRDIFACVWTHRMPETAAPPVIVAPDGTIDLQWIDGVLRIAGPDKEPQTEIIPAGTAIVGFRFHPGAAQAWLGLPVLEIMSQRVVLEDLWGVRARRLANNIRDVEDIERALVDERREQPQGDAVMRAAFALIAQGPPGNVALIPWLCRALHMSERSLRRRFDDNFGYGPKTLDRILRYQRFRRLHGDSPATPTVLLALDAGYADQAHLVRESRRLTGLTPRSFLAP
ncbi:MAG: helix-turn-helix domain-containing protein [Pseudomonadota bacterium]